MTRRWVAFIRAINGSPHNRVRMTDLAAMLAEVGCADVGWHLQTGNMLFGTDDHPDEVAGAIEARLEAHGMRDARVLLRTPESLAALVARAPFAGLDPAEFQFEATFLQRPPGTPDTAELLQYGARVQHIDDTVVCFAFPRGGRMQGGFNGWIERKWRIAATSRAWNVVEAVSAKASAG